MKTSGRFKIGQRVRIFVGAGEYIEGTVLAVCIRALGVSYQVAWWVNGQREEEWLDEFEMDEFEEYDNGDR